MGCQYLKTKTTLNRVSPSRGETGGDPPLLEKFTCPPARVPPQFCRENVDFVIFMQFLAILSTLSPHKSTPAQLERIKRAYKKHSWTLV